MLAFSLVAALMLAVALAFVLVPLLRARAPAGPSATEANLEVLRGQRREIDADVASGVLPRDARDAAVAELVDRAQEDLPPAEAPAPPVVRKPWEAATVVALAIPALAIGLYLKVGNPGAIDPPPPPPQAAAGMDDKQIVAMVENLARKVRERPDDAQGWALLARSMNALGRFQESADAYAHLNKLVPNDAQVLADYADALGMAQGRKLAGRPAELVREALKVDPANRKALALAGTAALDQGDFTGAIGHWEKLAAQAAPGSQEAEQVRAIIGEIRTRAASAGKPVAGGQVVAQAPAAQKTVSGSIAVAPEIAARVAGTETVFIFARAEGGSRMPLAVVRASARELPLRFSLDDTQAMAPTMKLSSAEAVRIEARVSKSGNATPQPGDLVGTSAVVKPGARDVRILVDKVLP